MGCVLGFLLYNFPPATIFMGDAGSLFVGYNLSVLTIMNTYYRYETPTALPVVMPLVVLAVPIFDTLSVIAIRMKNRRPVFCGDRNHFSHRLANLGMSHRQVALFIYLVTFCVGLNALLLRSLNIWGGVVLLIQAAAIIAIIAILERTGKNRRGTLDGSKDVCHKNPA
jgi:UDP-GlcNAc:undecaprenyl-phosphate GlcNAc-1-phosphate transferase